jgi:hypothetical protein
MYAGARSVSATVTETLAWVVDVALMPVDAQTRQW